GVMRGTLQPSIHRAPRQVGGIGVLVHVDVLADNAVSDADPADSVGGGDTVGTVMREIMAYRHVVTVASRDYGESRREFQRLLSGASAFLVYQVQDFGFLPGQTGYFFGSRRRGVHEVKPCDYRSEE